MSYGSIRIFSLWQIFSILLSVLMANAAIAEQDAGPDGADADGDAGTDAGNDAAQPGLSSDGSPEVSAPPHQCIPQCRSGFMCHEGLCVSSCNPPCAEGQTCSGEGECLAATPPPAQQTPAPARYDARLTLLAERQRIRDERLQVRLAYRNKLRLTLYGMLMASDSYDYAIVGGGFQFGVRKQFAGKVAFHGRASFFIGGSLGTDDAVDGKNVMMPGADVAVLFGPFGRFYFGPLFWFQADIFPNRETYTTWDGETRDVENQVRGGFGMELGVLIGRHEHIDLNLRGKREFDMYSSDFMQVEFGVGFHFFPGD